MEPRRLARLAPARARPQHAGMQQLIRDLNRVYRTSPRSTRSTSSRTGFRWLDANDADANTLAFLRARATASACSRASATSRRCRASDYRVGLPHGGRWREALNTDSELLRRLGRRQLRRRRGGRAGPWHEQPYSAELTLPPLGVVWLVPEEQARLTARRRAAAGRHDGVPRLGAERGAVSVRAGGEEHPLEPGGRRVLRGAPARARPATTTASSLDGGELRRPVLALRSRTACAGRRASLDTARVRVDAGPVAVPLDELVIYELHVGTFTRGGHLRRGVGAACASSRELGVTAIELMPVATFPGERGWGYDGVLTYAPHRAYGGPEGLARLVDAAHARGARRAPRRRLQPPRPGRRASRRFGPYFTDRHETLLGRRDRLLAAAACASGRSRTPSCGCATTASTACGSTRSHAIFDESRAARPARARRPRARGASPARS